MIKLNKDLLTLKASSPLGPAELGGFFGWINQDGCSDGPITCQLCGTLHPESDNAYAFSRVMGLEIVEDCCGAVIDSLFFDLGYVFTVQFLEKFAERPNDLFFGRFRSHLEDTLKKAVENLKSSLKTAEEIQKIANQL